MTKKEREFIKVAINFYKTNNDKSYKYVHEIIDLESDMQELSLHAVSNWVAVTDKLPPRPDEDYEVCVKNKNKEGGIPIQDIKQFTSDGIFVGGNPDIWERVVFWKELTKPPCY